MRLARGPFVFPAAVMMLLVGSVPALAAQPLFGGLAIRWDNCYGDGGTINRNFACNTNAGTNNLSVSFLLDHDTYSLPSSLEVSLGVAAAGAQLPAWWSFKNAGACRTSSLSASFVIPATAINCIDAWSGQGAGGIATYDVGAWGPNSARILVVGAVPAALIEGLFGGQEYFTNLVRFDDAKTVGTGACAGCAVPVCIVLQSIRLHFQTEPQLVITLPLNGTDSHYATWQGGGVPGTSLGAGCPAATPTRRGTWGTVKALYR